MNLTIRTARIWSSRERIRGTQLVYPRSVLSHHCPQSHNFASVILSANPTPTKSPRFQALKTGLNPFDGTLRPREMMVISNLSSSNLSFSSYRALAFPHHPVEVKMGPNHCQLHPRAAHKLLHLLALSPKSWCQCQMPPAASSYWPPWTTEAICLLIALTHLH